MKTLTTVLTIALAGLAASVAQAWPPGTETTASVVNFADLNLQSPAGIAQLRARIRGAAHQVCGSVDSRNLLAVSYVRACRLQAEARAIASVDAAVHRLHRDARLLPAEVNQNADY